MKGFTLDADGYPTDETLERIEQWPPDDAIRLCENVVSIWWPDASYTTWGKRWLQLHTNGWSGNEDLICSLQNNSVFWLMYWESSRRGGHHTLDLEKMKRLAKGE